MNNSKKAVVEVKKVKTEKKLRKHNQAWKIRKWEFRKEEADNQKIKVKYQKGFKKKQPSYLVVKIKDFLILYYLNSLKIQDKDQLKTQKKLNFWNKI